MSDIVVDPDLVFISDAAWLNEDTRDGSIERLIDLCNFIEGFDHNIIWTDVLDEAMWMAPQPLPWRSEPSTRNRIIPILHKKFVPKLTRVGDIRNYPLADSTPSLAVNYSRAEVRDEFLRVVTFVGSRVDDWTFFTTEANAKLCTRGLAFDAVGFNLSKPFVITRAAQYFIHERVHDFFWPLEKKDFSIFSVTLGLNAAETYARVDGALPQEFVFSEHFQNDLIASHDNRAEIWSSLSKRIAYGQQKASADGGLSDEQLKTKAERRFRVNGECRIHYSYTDAGQLYFLRYYREGEHDDGL